MFNPEDKDTIAFRLVISSLAHQKVAPKSIISVTFMSFSAFLGILISSSELIMRGRAIIILSQLKIQEDKLHQKT